MKEIYESPELNLISYIPAENLATGAFGFDDLVDGNGGQADKVISGDPVFDY